LHMVLYAPMLYFFFYIMDFIQIVAIVRCLLHPRTLLHPEKRDTTWVSPERAGQQVHFSKV